MSRILGFMPTYSPDVESSYNNRRLYRVLLQHEIAARINDLGHMSREKPWVYMDCIDSVLNIRPDIELVVCDGRSTESIRGDLVKHHEAGDCRYHLELYPNKESQWNLFNDVMSRHMDSGTEYVVYTSSDVIWTMDWVGEAIKEFERDDSLMVIFPLVSSGDGEFLPIQVSAGPRDEGLIVPPYQGAARAPVLNMYAAVFRADFFRRWGGYMNIFRNCFTESFLYYQCEALGGKMRLMPRGWVYHHNAVDAWSGEGGSYHYLAEKPLFDKIMDRVQIARIEKRMTFEFLRQQLYRDEMIMQG